MIKISGIKKSYHRKMVLAGIDLEARKGDVIGIFGRNGCGKSTLLSILAGALKPDCGEIFYQGEDMRKTPRLFSKFAAYVPQENPIIEELSVYDNLKLWYSFSQADLKEDLKSGTPYLLGLAEVQKQAAGKLSGGMKKRLSIAGALANQANLLILDEFGAALDFIMEDEILEYLAEYQRNGGTIIMASHDERELQFCNRLYALKDGVLSALPEHATKEVLTEALR